LFTLLLLEIIGPVCL